MFAWLLRGWQRQQCLKQQGPVGCAQTIRSDTDLSCAGLTSAYDFASPPCDNLTETARWMHITYGCIFFLLHPYKTEISLSYEAVSFDRPSVFRIFHF